MIVPRHVAGSVILVDRNRSVVSDPKAVLMNMGVPSSSSPEVESKKPLLAALGPVAWLTLLP